MALFRMSTIKVPLRSNCRYPFFFYIFVDNRSFRKVLPNFNLLRTLELTFFGPLFPRFYGRHYFYLVPVLVKKWSEWCHSLKNTTRVEITITIGTAILIKNNKKLCSYIRAIFCINCDYNFNPCGIFESMTSFTPCFNQDWNKEN